MFDLLRKLFRIELPQPPAPAMTRKEREAFQLGRDALGAYANDVAAYMEPRLRHAENAFIQVTNQRVDAALAQDEFAPILYAREQIAMILEHITQARNDLVVEVKAMLFEWDTLNRKLGVEEEMEVLVMHMIEDRFVPLREACGQVAVDRAEELKAAERAWAAKFPDKAREQSNPMYWPRA